MQTRTLHDIEHEAWSQRASFYDDLFARISTKAIEPILDSLGDLQAKCLLDVACGTGHLVAVASQRGALSGGIDFAEPMIGAARANYPNLSFEVADAAQLPYDDESFDVATCSFGLSHMEDPQKAVSEVFRVLRPGGRFSFTLWCSADDGGELFAIGQDAIAAHTTTPFALPNSWTQLRFADEKACKTFARRAGFKRPTFRRLPIVTQSTNAESMFALLDKLSVRTKMILDSQPASVRQLIREYVLSEIEARRVNGVITLEWPALLTTVQKPK